MPYDAILIPGIGIGAFQADGKKIIHNFSLNLLVGNSAKLSGLEFGGLMNYNSENVLGVQVAGISNIAGGELNGIQIAGIFNKAKKVKKGIQIGLVNISEENEGVPLGLFSYVQKVGIDFDLWVDEQGFLYLGAKSGTESFYNTPFIGIRGGRKTMATYGGMYGWRKELFESFYLNIDISSQGIINRFDKFSTMLNMMSKLRIISEIFLWKSGKLGVSIFGGPVFNAYLSAEDSEDFIYPLLIYKYDSPCDCGTIFRQRYWLGFVLGIRLY